MTYLTVKYIKGNPYLYEVRSERDGDRVRQVFVRYLGRADKDEAIERQASVSRKEVAIVKPEKVTPEPSPISEVIPSTWFRGTISKELGGDTFWSADESVGGDYGTIKVGEQAEKTELEDSARFQDIYKPLHSSKGAKSTTIQVAQFEINKPNIKVSKEGYDIGNGIGIVIHGEGKNKTYTVTHLNTGLAMGHECKDRLKAIALAKAEAKIDDWSKYETEKDVPKETMNTASALVRAFTGETMDTELASKLE